MRLTGDLIEQGQQSLNPTGDRTLAIRGRKIALLENLSSTKDQYECIDLSDNDIQIFEKGAELKNLKVLILSHNRITKLAPGSLSSFPSLKSLVLSYNKISTFSEIRALEEAKNLKRLSFLENPITKEKHFRAVLIRLVPSLKYLDFQKVTDEERKSSKELFSTLTLDDLAPLSGARKIEEEKENEKKNEAEGLSPELIKKLRDAISCASSVEEVNKLENALKTQKVSDEILKILEEPSKKKGRVETVEMEE